jgi:putative transposase
MALVRIWIHGVWATKSREKWMTKTRRVDLFKHIKSYAKEKNIYLDFINGESDHVHVLLSMKCDQNIAQIMALLKGESASHANKAKLFGNIDFDWADDYYAVSVSQSQVVAVREYIKNQEEHHKKKTFEEECKDFIANYGFPRILGDSR